MGGLFTNFRYKFFGDRRGKTVAIREAGFDNEVDAVRWVNSIVSEPLSEMAEPALIKQIRDRRPDLTLATASYIAKRAKARFA